MNLSIRFKMNTDIKKKIKHLGDQGQKVLDNEVLKSSNIFVPMDTQELMRSSIRATELGSGKIIWDTPYAKRLYYNPQYNFSKDLNPKAQGLWFEAAKAKDLKSWLEIMDKLKDELI